MKKALSLLIVLALVASLVGCSPSTPVSSPTPTPSSSTETSVQPTPESKPDPIEIRVIYHPTIGGSTAIAIAEAKGYFEEENLKISYQRFTAGPPEIAAMVAGRADIGFIGSGAAWLAFRGDVNIIALDNLALTDEVVAKKSSGISTLADLKGKKIATQLGTAGENILNLALEKAGIDKSEVTIMNMDNNNLAAAIVGVGSDIDAMASWKPATTTAMEALGDDGIILCSNRDFPDNAFPSTWVANKDFVKNNPDAVQRFVNALTKAQDYRSANIMEAAEWASEKAGQPANDLYLQLEDAVWPSGAEMKDYYVNGGFENMLLNLRSNQIASGKITEADIKDIKEVYIDKFAIEATKGY